jgi:alpha-tubulin suppressor-like RCC1 family protein
VEVDELHVATESIYGIRGSEVWVKGWNEHGNLGTGDIEDKPDLTLLPLNIDPKLRLSMGGAFAILY